MEGVMGKAEMLYAVKTVTEGMTIKEYVPAEVLEFLHPVWHNYPPESQFRYYLFALWYIIGGLAATFGNSLVLFIFSKYSPLRTPANMLVMNLAFCDLMLMLTLVPECIVNFMMGGVWQWGDFACQIHAFCGSIFGYGQIATLVFISIDRYNVIVRGFAAKPLTFGRVSVYLLFIWLFATFWATGPLVGYGSYALDGILATCSYGYMNQDASNVAYITGCFIAAFVLPLFIITICYWHIVKAVFAHEATMREQAKKMNVASLKANDDSAKQSAEIRIAKVAMINISLWVVAWTPFAAICMTGVWGDQVGLTPMVSSLPVIFAKTSCFYNPIIYAISHPKYRQCLKKELPWMCINEPIKDNASSTSGATKVIEETA